MAPRPRRPRDRDRRAGFLLTETLATFVISAFVLVSLASVAQVLMRAIDASVARVQDSEGLGRTIDALSRDVGSLSRARWSGFEPQPYVFRGGPNSLYFAHREMGAGGLPELHVIALREIVTDHGAQLVRSEARLSATAGSFEELHFVSPRPLDTGAARLRFAYVVPPEHNAPPPPPRGSWPVGALLPDAVLIEAVDVVSHHLILSTRVPIRATADIGCLGSASTSPPAATGDPPAPIAAPPPSPDVAPVSAQATIPNMDAGHAFCGRPDAKTADNTPGTPPPPPSPPGGQL